MLRGRWLELATCRVDLDDGGVVHHDGRTERLTANEVRLLGFLATHPEAPHTREALLQQVWGYAPAVLSRTVEVTVRRLRQKIEADPSEPDHLLTERGSGYRFRGPRADVPPPTAVIRHNLRRASTPLAGRAEALAALAAAVDAGQGLVEVVGPPGIGKSRLARAHAERAIDAGAYDEVWWCDLDGVTDAAGAAERVLRTIGAEADVPPGLAGRVVRERGRVLLVVDHVEAIDGGPEWLRALTEHAPRLALAVCSRRILGLGAAVRLAPLDPDASLALFDARVHEARGAPLTDEERADAAGICAALDGVPLGIELAAARAAVLPIDAVRSAVSAWPGLLGRRGGALREREATLDGALAASVDALTPDARAVLLQCALFSAPFPLTALLAASPLPTEAATIDAFDALAEHCLVQLHPARGGPNHLTLLAPIRAHARARLVGDGAVAAAERHQRWVLAEARRSVTSARAVAADLAAVIARLADRADAVDARAEATLAWVEAGANAHANDRDAALLDAFDAHLSELSAAVRVRWLALRAQVAAAAGQTGRAEAFARRAVAVAEAEAPEGCDRARLQLGRYLAHAFDPAQALAVLDTVGTHDPAVQRACLRERAGLLVLVGRVSEARASLAGLGPSASWEDDFAWGRQLRDEGQLDAALVRFDAALAGLEPHDDGYEPRIRNARATALIGLARFDEAEAELKAASAVSARFGQVHHAAVLASNAAALALARGDPARAARGFAEVRDTAEALGHAYLATSAAGNLAVCALDAGDLDPAAAALDDVVTALDGRDVVRVATVYRCYRVLVAVLRGDPDARARADALLAVDGEPTPFVRATVGIASGAWDADAAQGLTGAMRRTVERAWAVVRARDGAH